MLCNHALSLDLARLKLAAPFAKQSRLTAVAYLGCKERTGKDAEVAEETEAKLQTSRCIR
jgi:hypothetical protein